MDDNYYDRDGTQTATLASAPPTPGPLQRALRPLIVVVMVAAVIGGYFLYRHTVRFPSTDDAYVQGNVVQIAPQVSGPVAKVYVVNNQHVSAGEPLFQIDPAPFAIAVDAAQASFEEAVEAVGANDAGVAAAAARVRQAQATLVNAQNEAERGRTLRAAGNLSASALDTREASLKQAEAGLAAANAELEQAQQQAGHSGKENARLRAASAALRKTQLDFSYTDVRAPSSGWVSDLSLRDGAMATMGRAAFAIVEDNEWWVDAHFKETDITRLRPGQPADVSIDMYPGRTFKGVVQSISEGSGATFSMMPPENASGNWVKVTQRYTVRIKILDVPPDPNQPLRVGASARAEVDTGG